MSGLGYQFPQIDICRCRSDFSRVASDWTIITHETHGAANGHLALSGRSLLQLLAPTHVPPRRASSFLSQTRFGALQSTLRVWGLRWRLGDMCLGGGHTTRE